MRCSVGVGNGPRRSAQAAIPTVRTSPSGWHGTREGAVASHPRARYRNAQYTLKHHCLYWAAAPARRRRVGSSQRGARSALCGCSCINHRVLRTALSTLGASLSSVIMPMATDHVTTAQRRERTAEASRANDARLCDDAAAVSTGWPKGLGVLGVPQWARGVQDRAVERRPKREPRLGCARRVSALPLAASPLHECTRACSEATRKGSQGVE